MTTKSKNIKPAPRASVTRAVRPPEPPSVTPAGGVSQALTYTEELLDQLNNSVIDAHNRFQDTLRAYPSDAPTLSGVDSTVPLVQRIAAVNERLLYQVGQLNMLIANCDL